LLSGPIDVIYGQEKGLGVVCRKWARAVTQVSGPIGRIDLTFACVVSKRLYV